MKYIDEFRDGALAQRIGAAIRAEADSGRSYRLMEFCGGHTHAIARYGIEDLLPGAVRLIHGPGCPVCVLPIGRIDSAIALAREQGVVLATYADVMRVPASEGRTLMSARAQGADVRMVYSVDDALQIARDLPGRQVVFLAIGFETTTPPTAAAVLAARDQGLANFSVLCNHVLTPAAIGAILGSGEAQVDAIVGPAHVSTVIGSAPYEFVAREHGLPLVISGFEPLDLMQSILMLLRQLNSGRAEVENQFLRSVRREGNLKAQAMVQRVFSVREQFEWRGLGTIAHSALRLADEFADLDAELRFATRYRAVPDHKQCDCGAILRGLKQPRDCRLFATVCTPRTPMGSCMVSSEGGCAAYYTYGRHREPVAQP